MIRIGIAITLAFAALALSGDWVSAAGTCAAQHGICINYCNTKMGGTPAECAARCGFGLNRCTSSGCWTRANGTKVCGLR